MNTIPKILLTINLEGVLKFEKIIVKHGNKKVGYVNESKTISYPSPCNVKRTLTLEAYNHMTDRDYIPHFYKGGNWNKLSAWQRLDQYFKYEANGREYSFEILQD